MKRINRLKNDQRGFSMVFVGVGFLAFMAMSMLAIDVGMLMTARSQAQNAADAGALAGATALAYNDFDDRTPTGPAVKNAIAGAKANQVMSKDVAVDPADVTFPNDPDGYPTRVQVNVFRTAGRGAEGANGGPVSTFIARIFNINTVDISATATAEASAADTMTCVKPFTIPDRWWTNGNKDTPSTGDTAFNPASDVYNPNTEDLDHYTGYNAERDKGTLLTLKTDNQSKVAPSFYFAWDMDAGDAGADDYRWNIGNCNVQKMGFNDLFTAEPGNMVGPTKQGMQDLIDKDPRAKWDQGTKSVVDSNATNGPSPRVVAIPLFDPVYYYNNKTNGRNASLRFVNYLGFFVEDMQGNEVRGRIVPIGGLRLGGKPAPKGAFPRVIRLVK